MFIVHNQKTFFQLLGIALILTDPYGYITSPGYPNFYCNDVESIWLIQLPHGELIEIEFFDGRINSYNTNCPYDKIKIYDGGSMASPVIGRYCGNPDGQYLISSTNEIIIRFLTNNRWVYRPGFKLQYKAVSKCSRTKKVSNIKDLINVFYIFQHISKSQYFFPI